LALWVVHDNPRLRNQLISTGPKKMKCLVETKDPSKKNCVRIITGIVDYSGSVLGSGFDEEQINLISQGTECIRLCRVMGYHINYDEVEKRLSKDKSVQEFRLNEADSIFLTGEMASMSAKDFLRGCHESIDVILDPQCSPDGWYPFREATSTRKRKIAPQFRSKGIGYIRLGDDMGKHGLAFLSSDACHTFLSSAIALTGAKNVASAAEERKICDRKKNTVKISSSRMINRREDNQEQRKDTYVSDENDEDLSLSITDDSGESDNAGELLKQIESMEVSGTTKWQEKEDLIKRLGKAASSSDGSQFRSGALNAIQDVLSSKNVNVHVLRSAVLAVGRIGKAMEKHLVTQMSWRVIMIETLKLLKSKQACAVAKETLKQLHGRCYTLGNSLTLISQALGLGKIGQSGSGKRQIKKMGSNTSLASIGNEGAKKAANNTELIEWLAEVTEAERSMPDAVPMIDKAGLCLLSRFFLSHKDHRDSQCRKNVLDGLLHTILYGINQLGLKDDEAQSLCCELKQSNPKGWKSLVGTVKLILAKERTYTNQTPNIGGEMQLSV